MMAAVKPASPHIPVLRDETVEALQPVEGGVFVDGTFGAGGYSRALLRQGAKHVIGIDRDPSAIAAAERNARLTLVEGTFSELDAIARAEVDAVDGVVLDIGVSSMQLDQAERGFSFMRDGPLDMRMSSAGMSAQDLVNEASEAALADIIYNFGEDKASRRIARAIVLARAEAPIERTLQLADIIREALPPARPGQIHPATRTFQALRIYLNDELGQLVEGLHAAEELLPEGGRLAIVTFHSLEDRIVKRFFQLAGGQAGGGSRHEPERDGPPPRFERPRKAVTPGEIEIADNPRARSARLRSAVRTAAPAVRLEPRSLGMPKAPDIDGRKGRRG